MNRSRTSQSTEGPYSSSPEVLVYPLTPPLLIGDDSPVCYPKVSTKTEHLCPTTIQTSVTGVLTGEPRSAPPHLSLVSVPPTPFLSLLPSPSTEYSRTLLPVEPMGLDGTGSHCGETTGIGRPRRETPGPGVPRNPAVSIHVPESPRARDGREGVPDPSSDGSWGSRVLNREGGRPYPIPWSPSDWKEPLQEVVVDRVGGAHLLEVRETPVPEVPPPVTSGTLTQDSGVPKTGQLLLDRPPTPLGVPPRSRVSVGVRRPREYPPQESWDVTPRGTGSQGSVTPPVAP